MDGNNVEGNIAIEVSPGEEENTLDEPISKTLKRDVKAVLKKLFNVVLPSFPGRSEALLHDWDLWGPLVLCLIISFLLQQGSSDGSVGGGIKFVQAFILLWTGAIIVTINTQLLKGKVSFFQCVCTLGYSLTPLTISLLILKILSSFMDKFPLVIVKFVLCGVAMSWSIWAALGFLRSYLPEGRKFLAIYPIFLFYFAITLLIGMHK